MDANLCGESYGACMFVSSLKAVSDAEERSIEALKRCPVSVDQAKLTWYR